VDCGFVVKFAYLIEPPFNYLTVDGTVTGCDVELARYVFSQMGVASFEPVETEFAELIPGVMQGRWRMTTGLFATDERRQAVAFTRPIWALADGLLVGRGNASNLSGYASVADNAACTLAVVRDQYQHRSALEFGVPEERILIFETYGEAAAAVRDGRAGAYASVARAHAGFIERNPEWDLDVVAVPDSEKQPAFGAFAVGKTDDEFRRAVDTVLDRFIGSPAHRSMMAEFGFGAEEIDRLMR
jgi:polar amino acid transport system substrate-binding protein